MKILINTPTLSLQGGVADYYRSLIPFWSEDVKYNAVGKRRERGTGNFWFAWDIVKFAFILIIWQPDIVLINPSLGNRAIVRDSIFLDIAFLLHKRVIVFIRGWDKEYEEKLDKKKFTRTFNKAASILVLAKEFKKSLIQWGITIPINVTTTKVDDQMIEGFDIDSRNGEIKTLLFLSRVEVEKGIFITIDIFNNLKKLQPCLKLRIVGGGGALKAAKKYVLNNDISEIVFTGLLRDKALKNEFENADIFILPTFWGEGMPASVLEAMAFGLPVITRPVGGLVDFFENNKMGIMIESLRSEDYVSAIIQLINSPENCRAISFYNHFYAKEHFLASIVARDIENYAKKVCKDSYNII